MGLGMGGMTDTEHPTRGVANGSTVQLLVDSHLCFGNCPGVAGDSRGYGSASLVEVLNSLPNLTAPAACASQGAAELYQSSPPCDTNC